MSFSHISKPMFKPVTSPYIIAMPSIRVTNIIGLNSQSHQQYLRTFCPLARRFTLLSMNQCTILFTTLFNLSTRNLLMNQRTALITIRIGELNTSKNNRKQSTLRSTMLSAVQAFFQRSFKDNFFLSFMHLQILSSSRDL